MIGLLYVNFKSSLCSHYFYGFNTQEKEDEIAQGIYTAEYWKYDSRIGRRWNLDPKPQTSISDYACFANNPMFNIDHKGDTTYKFNGDGSFQGVFDDGKKEVVGKIYQEVANEATGECEEVLLSEFKFNDLDLDRSMLNDPNFSLDVDFTYCAEEMIDLHSAVLQSIIDNQGQKSKSDRVKKKKQYGSKLFPVLHVIMGHGANEQTLDFKPAMERVSKGSGNKLFIIDGVAYNTYDAGNFMTGATLKKVANYSTIFIRLGAHYNNHFHGNEQNEKNPNFVKQKGIIRLDSKADQRALKHGATYQKNR